MFTSDERKFLQSNLTGQICLTIFSALFGAVYEYFGHGVYSYYMIYAFAVPLVLAVLPLSLILLREKRGPEPAALLLWSFGTVTLTAGCLFRGILEIYGTTSRLGSAYPIAAGILFAAAAAVRITADRRRERSAEGGI